MVTRAALLAVLALIALGSASARAAEDARAATVARWAVVEFELAWDGQRENPFQDVDALATATGPDGAATAFDGFYDGDGTWRFRFVPTAHGAWTLDMRLVSGGKVVASATQPIACEGDLRHGFIRVSRKNPYRFEWDDATPYYPIGIQPGGIDGGGLDGPRQTEGQWRQVPMGEYMDAFRGKANLFRIQLGVGDARAVAGQVLTGKEGLYRYDIDFCRKLDGALATLRENGFAVILTPFQDMSTWGDAETALGPIRSAEGFKDLANADAVRPVKPYLRYLVARYGAWVDVWEIFNEDAYTPDAWLAEMAAFLRERDPYDHIISTDIERPSSPWCEIVTPHEYMWMPAEEIDAHLCKELLRFKSFGKPVLYTEFGNQQRMSNVDPVKWRVAVWVAFMNESGLLFWHSGGVQWDAPTRHNANAYLGPEARKSFEVFQNIVKDLPVDMRPVHPGWTAKGESLWAYALSNGDKTLLYIHHFGDHVATYPSRRQKTWTGPGAFRVTWFDPATGDVIARDEAKSDLGNITTIATPPVRIDAVGLVERADAGGE